VRHRQGTGIPIMLCSQAEGYIQIANIFLETADHEKEHAKRFFQVPQ